MDYLLDTNIALIYLRQSGLKEELDKRLSLFSPENTLLISVVSIGEAKSIALQRKWAVLGIGWAATVSLPFAIMSQKVDQSRMGLYMGLFNLSVVLPQLVASLGVGEFMGRVENKSVLFVICAVTLGISALSWMLVKEEQMGEVVSGVPGGGGH